MFEAKITILADKRFLKLSKRGPLSPVVFFVLAVCGSPLYSTGADQNEMLSWGRAESCVKSEVNSRGRAAATLDTTQPFDTPRKVPNLSSRYASFFKSLESPSSNKQLHVLLLTAPHPGHVTLCLGSGGEQVDAE